jgi:SAM-dependent methyltransferase
MHDDPSTRTLAHYNQGAESFRTGTQDHDVSQNIAAMLRHVEGQPPFTILDFGCGPGRDLRTFRDLGHVAIGLEGAPRFAAMAREWSGCDVENRTSSARSAAWTIRRHFRERVALSRSGAELHVLGELRAHEPAGVVRLEPAWKQREGWNRGASALSRSRRVASLPCCRGVRRAGHYYRPPGVPREQQPRWRRSSAERDAAAPSTRSGRRILFAGPARPSPRGQRVDEPFVPPDRAAFFCSSASFGSRPQPRMNRV